MKRNLLSYFILGAFMFVLISVPLQSRHINLVNSAYASHSNSRNVGLSQEDSWNMISDLGHKPDRDKGRDDDGNNRFIGNHTHEKDIDRGDIWKDILNQLHERETYLGNHEALNPFWSKNEDWDKIQDRDGHKFWGKNEGWDDKGIHGKGDGCDHDRDKGKHHDNEDGRCNKKVPEPSMFSLLVAGIAGVGIYTFLTESVANRKK